MSGRPDTWASARWDEFTKVKSAPRAGADASHFGTGVSNRYDYWRVAWHTFENDPIQGVGAGAFRVPWFRSRSIDENVTDAHSWQASALAETGLVGLALAAAVFLVPLARIGRRAGPGVWPIAAVALGGAGVYFVTAGLDRLVVPDTRDRDSGLRRPRRTGDRRPVRPTCSRRPPRASRLRVCGASCHAPRRSGLRCNGRDESGRGRGQRRLASRAREARRQHRASTRSLWSR